MKISTLWLRDFVDLDMLGAGSEQLAGALTGAGFPVEGIEEAGDDQILDIEVTTNRPDCLSHLGIAREVAACFRLPLTSPAWEAPGGEEDADLSASVEIADADLCPRYSARLIADVTIGESPEWLKKRLAALGQRPINNVVDVTNYVLFELGHPLHGFDHARLAEGRILVRRARPGEKITTLDGFERSLDPEMLLICDAAGPVAVGGVMGGADSEVTEATRTVLLESACFDARSIRRTSRELGLKTEASYRFERGADPELVVRALNRATTLLAQTCGGRVVGPIIDENPRPHRPLQLKLRLERVRQVVGTPIEAEEVADILTGLQFEPQPDGAAAVAVTVPSFRVDIAIEDDLVEEVARHYGYDRLPSHYPAPVEAGRYLATEKHDRFVASTLEAAGFFEAYCFSFTTPEREQGILGNGEGLVGIANPLTADATHLRSSLLPGLLDALRYNLNHGARDVRLYERGRVFRSGDGETPIEEEKLALIATGAFYEPFWNPEPEALRFAHLKAVLVRLGEEVESPLEIARGTGLPFLHPGVTAVLRLGDGEVGWAGRLHPSLERRLKLTQPVFAAEISLDAYRAAPLRSPRFRPIGRFPGVERDLSFVVDSRVEFSKIRAAVQALNIGELKDHRLIDLYQGPTLPPNKLSLTVRLTFADPDRTLTQDEVNAHAEQVSRALQKELAAELRS